MAWRSEINEDETLEIRYNTTTGVTMVINLDAEDEWVTPIDAEGTDEIHELIVPGFAWGALVMKVCKLIEKAMQ